MNREHAQRLTPLAVRPETGAVFNEGVTVLAVIDDLWLDALARAHWAALSVTPSCSSSAASRFLSLCRLCLLEAQISPQIGWDKVNVGQKLLVQTRAS